VNASPARVGHGAGGFQPPGDRAESETAMTSNEYYGAINQRHDRRAAWLLEMGYRPATLKICERYIREQQHCVWRHPSPMPYRVVLAAEMSHMDERAWVEIVETPIVALRGHVVAA
jgi:hypothetical protein